MVSSSLVQILNAFQNLDHFVWFFNGTVFKMVRHGGHFEFYHSNKGIQFVRYSDVSGIVLSLIGMVIE